MRLRWRGSSPAEDQFEKWIAQRHQQRVLEGNLNPVGPHPDDAFLKELAAKSERIPLSDPRVDHAASCSICMGKLLSLRKAHIAPRSSLKFATAIVACLIIAVAIIVVARRRADTDQATSNVAVVSQTVDLFNSGAYRGEQPSELQSVSLPAAMVRATVILPRFSEPGRYVVAVMHDQASRDLIAQGSATANSIGDKEQVTVDLDLRNARSGAYFLSTTHEQEKASYYYPLQIK